MDKVAFEDLPEKEKNILESDAVVQLDECLPIHFENGFTLTSFGVACGGCRRQIPKECIRGIVTRPIESVAEFKVYGVCNCGGVTITHKRVRADKTGQCLETIMSDGTVARQIILPTNAPVWAKVLLWIIRFFRAILARIL